MANRKQRAKQSKKSALNAAKDNWGSMSDKDKRAQRNRKRVEVA